MERKCVRCQKDISNRHKGAWMCCDCASVNFFDPIKQRARALVARARAKGVLADPRTLSCVDCGGAACQYDHREYAKPLSVSAVCRKCNARRGPALDSITRETMRPAKNQQAA